MSPRRESLITKIYNYLLLAGFISFVFCLSWRVVTQAGKVDLYLRQDRETWGMWMINRWCLVTWVPTAPWLTGSTYTASLDSDWRYPNLSTSMWASQPGSCSNYSNPQVGRDLLTVLSNSKLWLEEAILDSKEIFFGEDKERKVRQMEERLNRWI